VTTRAIKAVLFDLDGTLYDRDRLAGELFELQYTLFAAELLGV
jgi:FMN phosphatase YigB (HAD superfamily)